MADIRVLRAAGMLGLAEALGGRFVEQWMSLHDLKRMMYPDTKDFRTCNGYVWAVKHAPANGRAKVITR